MKTLLLALLVGLAAIAGLTLSAAAQPGGDGADDADPQGRIIARIQDRTGDDGVDDYRIEFGFFPEWAMDDKDPWSEAVATWSDWLPARRYLTKTVIDRRAAADNRRWLRSSLISVPASASAQPSGGGTGLEDDGANGQSLIEGRVIARYHPDSRGRLRIEFGFLPEWAFARTANTEAAVEQYGGDFLPRARYISASMIESRRGVWLRSSVVELTSAPVVVIEQAPAIDSISCSPLSPTVDEAVTCTAALSGGAPDSWAWSGGASSGDSSTYNTTFSSAGGKTVSLTVSNSAGSDSDSTTLTVEQPLQAPTIDSVSCSPPQPNVDENVTCTATLSGGAPDTYAWQTANGSGAASEHSTSFSKAGEYAISLTVANAAGDDSKSITLTVSDELQAPAIDSISCPSSAAVGESVTCTASNSGGAIDSYSWSDSDGGSGSSSSYSTSFSTSGAKTVSLTARNSAGSDSDSTGVTVTGAPQININCPSAADVDERITCTVSNSGDTIDSYAWSDSDGGSGNSASYSTSFSSSGAKTIRVTARNSAGSDSDSASVRVTGAPVISVSCPSSAAVDQSVTCTVSNSGGAIDTYAWSDSDGGSGSSASYSTSFSSSGAKTVSLTARNSVGSDSDSTTVSVKEEIESPQINISCPSTAVVDENFTCSMSNSGGAIDRYSWSNSDGGGFTAAARSGLGRTYTDYFISTGAKTVSLTATNSAGSDSASTTIEAIQTRKPIISIACTSPVVVDESVTCTVNSLGGAINTGGRIETFSWSDSDGGSGSGASYSTSFSTAGAKTVSLTASNAAGSDSDSTTVSVEEEIEPPEINISCPSTADAGQSVACTVSNSGGAIDSYAWSDSDGGSGSSSSYSTSFSTSGAKTIRLTARNAAGSDSDSASVSVRLLPPRIDSINCSPSVVAKNERVTCTVDTSGGPVDSYEWQNDADSSDKGSGSSFSTSFSTAYSKRIRLIVRNAAGHDGDWTFVDVRPEQPDITVSCPSSADVGERITCTESNSGDEIHNYSWSDSDGGSYSTDWRSGPWSYSTSFSSAGTKTVSLTASNRAGSDSDSTTIEVRAPLARPVIDSISCSSSRPDVDEIITCTVSASGGAIDSYAWNDSGGGNSHGGRRGATFRVSFVFDGTEIIRLTVRNAAGSDSETITVEVQPVRPYIVISCPSSAGVDERVTCTLRNSGAAIDSYAWSDSDGGSGSSSSYSTSFSSLGAKTVSATASNSVGSHSDRATINVLPELPQISISCPSSAVLNESVTCTVSNSGGAIDRYVWSDSDGGAGSDSSYSTSFRYTGQRTVRLHAHNAAGVNSDSVLVEVRAPPQPELQQPDVSISCPSSAAVYQPNVTCTASNSGGAIESYAWSDSDGGSGSGSSYSTSFTTAGAKTVSLTARNAAGSDNASTSVEVLEPPLISVSCPSSAAVNESITCTVSNSGGPIDTYAWSDNGGGSGSSASYSTSFSTTGVKTILLFVRSSAGSDNGSAIVEVRAASPPVQLPDVSISCRSTAAVDESVACTVDNSGGAIDSYAWSDSGGGSGSSSSYSTSFSTSGAKTVSLTATNSAGSDSASAGVNVIALPVITVSCPSAADTGETITCTVSNSGGAIVRYRWVDSDGGSGSSSSYSTSFSSAGAKAIRLTARNAAGAARDSTTIEVRAASP